MATCIDCDRTVNDSEVCVGRDDESRCPDCHEEYESNRRIDQMAAQADAIHDWARDHGP
jgi:hypothetical protein